MDSFTRMYMSAIVPESSGLESIGSAYANFTLPDDNQEKRAIVCRSEKSAGLAEIILNTQGVVAYEAYLEEICEKVEKDATVLAKQKARRAARITVLKKGVARAKSFVTQEQCLPSYTRDDPIRRYDDATQAFAAAGGHMGAQPNANGQTRMVMPNNNRKVAGLLSTPEPTHVAHVSAAADGPMMLSQSNARNLGAQTGIKTRNGASKSSTHRTTAGSDLTTNTGSITSTGSTPTLTSRKNASSLGAFTSSPLCGLPISR